MLVNFDVSANFTTPLYPLACLCILMMLGCFMLSTCQYVRTTLLIKILTKEHLRYSTLILLFLMMSLLKFSDLMEKLKRLVVYVFPISFALLLRGMIFLLILLLFFKYYVFVIFCFQIREAPNKRHNKLIEFYDVRAAEAALHALNTSEIGGKQIKLEPSRPGGIRRGYC